MVGSNIKKRKKEKEKKKEKKKKEKEKKKKKSDMKTALKLAFLRGIHIKYLQIGVAIQDSSTKQILVSYVEFKTNCKCPCLRSNYLTSRPILRKT